jgi:hypothetical protein
MSVPKARFRPEPPTSKTPAIQERIDIVNAIFDNQTEEEIFWLRYQGAIVAANKLRRSENTSFQARNEPLKEFSKKD